MIEEKQGEGRLTKNKICWKVLDSIVSFDGTMYSCFMSGKLEVSYRINEWSEAPKPQRNIGYHLLCFDTKSNAENYMEKAPHGESLLLFPCIVKSIIKNPPLPAVATRPTTKWPKGTIMAKKIMVCKSLLGAKLKIQEEIE
jgi:hypothetical protein